jgi:hypothetical protein
LHGIALLQGEAHRLALDRRAAQVAVTDHRGRKPDEYRRQQPDPYGPAVT